MDESIDDFRYSPLDHQHRHIRLLKLFHSASENDIIRCQLIHTSLSNAPPYDALSYAWGTTPNLEPIYINEGKIVVTNNLLGALKRLRSQLSTNDEKFFWVDAICIDQNNIPERNIQIGMMRSIFQQALTVPVWLGPERSRSSVAIRLVRELNSASNDQVTALLQDSSRRYKFHALMQLFRREYWWRIWVIQEVSCAREVMVHCGDESIPMAELNKACDIMKMGESILSSTYFKSPSFVRTLVAGGPRGLQPARYQGHHEAEPPLFELLLSHKSKKSTDPRDKVYALVGISSSRNTFGPMDYHMPIRQVYTHTAKHIIGTSHRLDIICVKQLEFDYHDLPTWVPDWTRSHKQNPTVVGLQHSNQDFMAAGTTSTNVHFIEDGYVLKTTGLIIDTVRSCGGAFKRDKIPSDRIDDILRVLQGWWNTIATHKGVSIDEQGAFCRIISCGNWTSDDVAPYAVRMSGIATALSQRFPHISFPLGRLRTGGQLTEKEQIAMLVSASFTMNRRRFIITDSKIIGLAPLDCEKNDLICVLPGCRFPVVLRPQDNHFLLIGEAYIDGFMFGEAILEAEKGTYSWDVFEIH